MVFRLRADDGPTLNAGLVVLQIFKRLRTSIAKKHYIFVIFQGSRDPCPPSGSANGIFVCALMSLPHSAIGWPVIFDCDILACFLSAGSILSTQFSKIGI